MRRVARELFVRFLPPTERDRRRGNLPLESSFGAPFTAHLPHDPSPLPLVQLRASVLLALPVPSESSPVLVALTSLASLPLPAQPQPSPPFLFHLPPSAQWMNGSQVGHNQCPICKSGVSAQTVVPVYGRGKDRVDPRTKTASGEGTEGGEGGEGGDGAGAGASSVPARPAGQRTEVPQYDGHGGPGGGVWGPGGGNNVNVQFSMGFGLFPSLFSLAAMGGGGATQRQRGTNTAPTPEEAHQQLLERIMFGLGMVILFFLLFL